MRMVYRFLPRFFSIVNMRILHLLSNEFFRSRKDEVIKVTHLDFTWERREELIRKEEREEGKEEGRKEGKEEGIDCCFQCLERIKYGAPKQELIEEGFEESVIDRAIQLLG